MQFTYHENSGNDLLNIDGDLHKYLFKIRRHNSDKNIYFRNLEDNFIYEYEVLNISKKDTILKLLKKEIKDILPLKNLHIAWCIVDPRNIEKYIASLNEIGVSKITFIRCEYSQKKYTINYEKINKLLFNSSSQCGRSNIIELDELNSFKDFITKYPDTYMFNFSNNDVYDAKNDIKTIAIGCEGGFSQDEINLMSDDHIVASKINSILKSETAVMSVSSIILS